MKWILAFVAALVASVWATNEIAQSKAATAKSWSSVLDKKCPRCVPSRLTAKTLPIPLPKRAIVYSFTGEFAHKSDIWLVDLNTGEIIHHEAIANDLYEWKATVSHPGSVDPEALERLRATAVSLWRSEPYDMLSWYSPGTSEEDYIISGSRLVAFSRFAPNDRDIVAAINSALPPEAAETNGSFVVISPRR